MPKTIKISKSESKKLEIQQHWMKAKVFFVKRVPGQGPEQREPNEAVLCLLIIKTLISYYYILLLNY